MLSTRSAIAVERNAANGHVRLLHDSPREPRGVTGSAISASFAGKRVAQSAGELVCSQSPVAPSSSRRVKGIGGRPVLGRLPSSCGSSTAEHRIVDPGDVGSTPIRSARLASVCYSRIHRRVATPQ